MGANPTGVNSNNNQYNTEAYNAYYNTAGSPTDSRSPSTRIAPQYQQYLVQSP